MTLKSQMAADIDAVFLNTDEHADSVTRYIVGSTSNTESVTVVFEPQSSQRDTQRGQENVRTALLYMNAGQSTDSGDGWLIDGERWEHHDYHSDNINGMKIVEIVRHDRDQTDRAGQSDLR